MTAASVATKLTAAATVGAFSIRNGQAKTSATEGHRAAAAASIVRDSQAGTRDLLYSGGVKGGL
jgi:hypothetical protein